MSAQDPLQELGTLAALVLEARLADLRRHALAKAETEAQLAGLEHLPAGDPGLEGAAAALAAMAYQRWAEARRRDLNRVLARQTAEWLEAADAARLAFGRNEALETLARRAAETKRR